MEKNIHKTKGILGFYQAIFNYAKHYPFLTGSLIFALFLEAACYLIWPFISKMIFDDALPNLDSHLLFILLTIFSTMILIVGICMVVIDYLSCKIGTFITDKLRSKIHTKILQLTTPELSKFSNSELISQFTDDLTMINYVITQNYWQGASNFIESILGIALLFYLDITMSLLMIILIGIVFWLSFLIYRFAIQYLLIKKTGDEALLTTFNETLSLHILTRILRILNFRNNAFNKALKANQHASVMYNFLSAQTRTIVQVCVVIIRMVMIAVGSYWVFTDRFTFGLFFGYLTLLTTVTSAINNVAGGLPSFVKATGDMERIQKLLRIEPINKERENFPALPKLAKKIVLKDVDYIYPKASEPTLKNINLEIHEKQSIAIVGTSGSGKSTLLNLLIGEATPTKGELLWDNCNVNKFSSQSLLAQIGVVLQTPCLFNMSVLDNIRLGKLNASLDEIIAAAKKAEIHDEIIKLNNGYDTIVGDGSIQLSIGQRQRVVLARALVGNPPLLILDEPTSSLDIITQDEILKTMLKQMASHTIILVTHHLKEAVNMNRIYVMHQGRIIESGIHDELLKLNGFYSKLWKKQTGTKIKRPGFQVDIVPDWLKQIPLFEDFNMQNLDRIANSFAIEHVPANKVIISEGDQGDKFYIIGRGQVEISKSYDSHKKKVIAVLEDGDFFGELALLRQIPRTANVITLEDSTFLVLYREQFQSLLEELPSETRLKFEEKARKRLSS